MKAMLFEGVGKPLRECDVPTPAPNAGQVLLKVRACAVCRTDLHIVDGDLCGAKLPIILGHEIVGFVVQLGPGADRFSIGDRVGVPWLGWTCGDCEFCRAGKENLCDRARFTGYHLDGGFAEFVVADERFCIPIPESYNDASAAPLLCAGLIGFRAYRMAGSGKRMGLYGFGAAAHILVQLAVSKGREVYAFTRDGDLAGQAFARELGAVWAGGSSELPPKSLDSALIFAPVGSLVPLALKAIKKGGIVVCAGIHMSDIPSFPYADLWGERSLCSVANLTKEDGEAFFRDVEPAGIQTRIVTFPLELANEALDLLRQGAIEGAAVLIPGIST